MAKRGKIEASKKNILEILKMHKNAVIPRYSLDSDVGLDLVAVKNICLSPMEQKTIKTGIAIKIPDGHVGLIRDRAGIVTKMNVHTVAGTFDPGYRGEVSVVMVNFSDYETEIEEGMKIAQLIIIPVAKVEVKEVKKLNETERGNKGFGSTGIKEKLKAFKYLEKEIQTKR
jgi:dUTP pyrophosphatase